jgi:hypothetical protein
MAFVGIRLFIPLFSFSLFVSISFPFYFMRFCPFLSHDYKRILSYQSSSTTGVEVFSIVSLTKGHQQSCKNCLSKRTILLSQTTPRKLHSSSHHHHHHHEILYTAIQISIRQSSQGQTHALVMKHIPITLRIPIKDRTNVRRTR